MAPPRSKRLAIVERLIEQQEQQLAKAVGMARQQLQQEEKKHQDLQNYLGDYESELLTQGEGGISGSQWQNFQFFIGQLEQAISQQRGAVQRAEQQIEIVLVKWRQVYQKRKSLGSLIHKIKLDELVEQEKKEQKQVDDLVNQMMQTRR